MNIIINTSTLYVGGGLQVALSFINELQYFERPNNYHIFMSVALEKQLDIGSFPQNFKFYQIEKTPARLKTRNAILKKLCSLEEQIKPDIVFSVFGPSYWKPKARHLMGFADGWVYNPESIVYDRLSIFKRIKMRVQGKYKSYYLKRDADYYVLETEDAKNKLVETVGLNRDNIFVVGNTYSEIFNDKNLTSKDNVHYIKFPDKQNGEFRLVYIAHNHINKNLKVINKILPFLEGMNIKFVLTLDEESFQNLFPHPTEKIINLGPIPQKSCPSVYRQCDSLFAPTLLETFSAAYPEAMKMGKPILTSNYSFATDICGDAAFYFDPLDPKDIAVKIKKLVNNKSLQHELVEKGTKRVKEFETARSRAQKYIALCEKLSKQHKSD